MARPVTLTTTLKNYGGDGAYLAIYVTDPKGAYAGTLWMAGGKSKYYEHLTDWYRATRGNTAEINGITGASVGAGRTLEITLDLADALFDGGVRLFTLGFPGPDYDYDRVRSWLAWRDAKNGGPR